MAVLQYSHTFIKIPGLVTRLAAPQDGHSNRLSIATSVRRKIVRSIEKKQQRWIRSVTGVSKTILVSNYFTIPTYLVPEHARLPHRQLPSIYRVTRTAPIYISRPSWFHQERLFDLLTRRKMFLHQEPFLQPLP